ncbi:MAG: hypothetical protein GX257_11325, partial [Clostridiales bacterium]|nr:hypothetical protein [Clostridiales bacterium]
MKRFFVCSVSFFFFLAAAVLADVTMRDIWHWGLVRKSDILPLATTQHVAAAVAPLATTQQVEAALRTYHYGSPDIVESPAEWFVFDGAGTIVAFNY